MVVAVPDVENPTRLTEKNLKPKKTPEKYLQIIIIKLFIVFNFFLDLNIAYISKYIYIIYNFCSVYHAMNHKITNQASILFNLIKIKTKTKKKKNIYHWDLFKVMCLYTHVYVYIYIHL